ncbi:MAG: aminoacyl-histidine dipeptidase, partial [Spirochaetales bacterium]|nr:aminoacyl-histidine dipeptidase [Spirochaetales bacterium]
MDTFEYFKQLCKIPRESGNEEGVRQYLLSWAKDNNFEAVRDSAGNIIIRAEATKGCENIPSVALQGHMDMVCVKTAESKHDFLKDPIEVYEDGDFLKAKDTSLGGDDGIAIAMVQALFTDPSAKHGPLEAIFTFSEETGMDGAFGLDGSLIRSRRLINIDSEEEGIIYIGCAGGIDLVGKASYEMKDVPSDWDTIEISLSGLKGGHSGGEIHQQRLNAVKALSRILVSIELSGIPFMLHSFKGGTRRN